jgi:hypothetical protein
VKEEYESKKEGFATKEDIAKLDIRIKELETKIVESSRTQIIWTVGTMIALFALLHFFKSAKGKKYYRLLICPVLDAREPCRTYLYR